MKDDGFYLHEDHWGMIELIPEENLKSAREELKKAEEFSKNHFDGQSWTDIYLIPDVVYPIGNKNISLAEIDIIMEDFLPRANKVESGYSTHREVCKNCFAYGYSYNLAFYGGIKDDKITSLYLTYGCFYLQEEDLLSKVEDILYRFGAKYKLILADWDLNKIVNLMSQEAINQYFKTQLEDDDKE